MDWSLINTKQCISYGISVCANPTDEHRSLGIDTEEDLITMGMKGTNYTFTTQCPIIEEFQQCLQILLRDKDNWDPSSKIFHISDMKEDKTYSTGRAPTTSQNICFVHLNSNSLFTPFT